MKAILTNCAKLQKRMSFTKRMEGEKKQLAIFQVSANLASPDIQITPSANDITKSVNKVVKIILETAHQFVRWMDGTCIETPPQIVVEDEEPIVFSFYTDISANPQIIKGIATFNQVSCCVSC